MKQTAYIWTCNQHADLCRFLVTEDSVKIKKDLELLLTLSRQIQAGKKWKTSKNSLLKVLQKCIFFVVSSLDVLQFYS